MLFNFIYLFIYLFNNLFNNFQFGEMPHFFNTPHAFKKIGNLAKCNLAKCHPKKILLVFIFFEK